MDPLRHTLSRSFRSSIHPQKTGLFQLVHLIRSVVRRWVPRPSDYPHHLLLGSVRSDCKPYPFRSNLSMNPNRSIPSSCAMEPISWDGNGCAQANLESASSWGGTSSRNLEPCQFIGTLREATPPVRTSLPVPRSQRAR